MGLMFCTYIHLDSGYGLEYEYHAITVIINIAWVSLNSLFACCVVVVAVVVDVVVFLNYLHTINTIQICTHSFMLPEIALISQTCNFFKIFHSISICRNIFVALSLLVSMLLH